MPTPWIYPSDRTILRYGFVPSLHHDLTRDEQVGKKGIVVEGPKATGPSCTNYLPLGPTSSASTPSIAVADPYFRRSGRSIWSRPRMPSLRRRISKPVANRDSGGVRDPSYHTLEPPLDAPSVTMLTGAVPGSLAAARYAASASIVGTICLWLRISVSRRCGYDRRSSLRRCLAS